MRVRHFIDSLDAEEKTCVNPNRRQLRESYNPLQTVPGRISGMKVSSRVFSQDMKGHGGRVFPA